MPNSTADTLTPTQRRQEVAAILGRGLLRLRTACTNPPEHAIPRPIPPTRKPLMCPRPATLMCPG